MTHARCVRLGLSVRFADKTKNHRLAVFRIKKTTVIKVTILPQLSRRTVCNGGGIDADVDELPALVEKQAQLAEEVGAALDLLDGLGGVGYDAVMC